MNWQEYVRSMTGLMEKMEVTDDTGAALAPNDAFARLLSETVAVRKRQNTIYCIGNGASASMASHFSADLAKNGQLHTEVFTDLALFSAIANDMGFEYVYSEPLRRRGVCGDLLLAISSSGESPNIISCCDCAAQLKMKTVTLSAMKPGNRLRQKGFLNFYFPADTYGGAESLHAGLLHYWIDTVVENFNK